MLKTLEVGSKKETVNEGLGISDERADEISKKLSENVEHIKEVLEDGELTKIDLIEISLAYAQNLEKFALQLQHFFELRFKREMKEALQMFKMLRSMAGNASGERKTEGGFHLPY